MDVFLGLSCALVGLVVAIGLPVWMAIRVTRAERALRALEARLAALEAGGARPVQGGSPASTGAPRLTLPAAPPPVAAAPPPAAPPPVSPPPVSPPPAAPPPRAPARPPVRVETLVVWFAASLGALVLVVAVLFALREAVRAGYVGPAVRFALAVAAGLGAWVVAEPLRDRGYRVPAEALAGGGVAVLYGALFAGHVRYGVIANPVAMALMVAVTLVGGWSAVRRASPLLAVLATTGGFLTPILLSTGENRAVAYFAYLGLVNAGVLLAAVRRGWWWLVLYAGGVTAALHVGWGVTFRAPDQVPVALIAAAGLAVLHLVAGRAGGRVGAATVAAATLLLLAGGAFVFPADPFRSDPRTGLPLRWSLGDTSTWAAGFVLVAAALLALPGRRAPLAAASGAVAATLLGVVTFLGWATAGEPRHAAALVGALGVPAVVFAVHRRAALVGTMLLVTGLAGAAYAAGGVGGLAVPMGVPMALAIGGGLLGVLVAELGRPTPLPAPLAGLQAPLRRSALLVGLVVGALPLHAHLDDRIYDGQAGLVFAAAVFTWAGATLVPLLRPRPGDLAGALAVGLGAVAVFLPLRAVWVERLGDDALGGLPLLLAVAPLLGARALRGVGAGEREVGLLLVAALAGAAVAVPLQLEEAWLTVGWAVQAVLLAELSRRIGWVGVRVFLGALAAAVTVRLVANPDALAYGGGEGPILFNWTLYTWGIPLACLLVAAWRLSGPPWLARALRVAATLVGFALVNVEVSHAFAHDRVLSFESETLAESMTRSIAWGLYGLVIIAVGVVRDRKVARLGGFAFAVLAAVKVCLVDVWNLSGFVRAGSFLGLAVVLLLAALAFQRVVLRERPS